MGTPGTDGNNGIDGDPGADGEPGAEGPAGFPGPMGTPGASGSPGEPGDRGASVSDWHHSSIVTSYSTVKLIGHGSKLCRDGTVELIGHVQYGCHQRMLAELLPHDDSLMRCLHLCEFKQHCLGDLLFHIAN